MAEGRLRAVYRKKAREVRRWAEPQARAIVDRVTAGSLSSDAARAELRRVADAGKARFSIPLSDLRGPVGQVIAAGASGSRGRLAEAAREVGVSVPRRLVPHLGGEVPESVQREGLSGAQIAGASMIAFYLEGLAQRTPLTRAGVRERGAMLSRRVRNTPRGLAGWMSGMASQALAEAAGTDRYVWVTSMDERVRETHAILEGGVFSYSDPPVTNDNGDVNNPGEDYNCRCVDRPVFSPAQAAAMVAAATALAGS